MLRLTAFLNDGFSFGGARCAIADLANVQEQIDQLVVRSAKPLNLKGNGKRHNDEEAKGVRRPLAEWRHVRSLTDGGRHS